MDPFFNFIISGGIYLEKEYDPFDVIFIDMYDKNYMYLVKYLFLLVNDFSIAEDLAHDIFLRVYRSKNIDINGLKFRNYIKKAARNIVIDHLKRSARNEAKNRKMIPVLKELDEAIYFSLEDCIIEGDVISTVQDVLDEFSEKNRKIFVSRILEQKSLKKVSEEEKISSHVVKRVENEILYTLRKKLKHFL